MVPNITEDHHGTNYEHLISYNVTGTEMRAMVAELTRVLYLRLLTDNLHIMKINTQANNTTHTKQLKPSNPETCSSAQVSLMPRHG